MNMTAHRALLLLTLCFSTMVNARAQNTIVNFMHLDSLESAGKILEAENVLLDLSNKNPYHEGFFYSLGKVHHKKGEYAKSNSAFRKAQDLGIEHRSNYYLASNYTKLGQYDSALFYLSRHLITPMNGDHPFEDDVLRDSVFLTLRTLPGYKSLLPPQCSEPFNRTENWATDINYLSAMLKKTHFDPFIQLSEAKWDQVIKCSHF